jgi:hypothetical protein
VEDDPASVALMIGFIYRGVIPGTEKKIGPFIKSIPPFYWGEDIPAVPMAQSINGSLYPFIASQAPGLSGQETIQHISLQPQYSLFSPEELRLADYQANRRYPATLGNSSSSLPQSGNILNAPAAQNVSNVLLPQHDVSSGPPLQSTLASVMSNLAQPLQSIASPLSMPPQNTGNTDSLFPTTEEATHIGSSAANFGGQTGTASAPNAGPSSSIFGTSQPPHTTSTSGHFSSLPLLAGGPIPSPLSPTSPQFSPAPETSEFGLFGSPPLAKNILTKASPQKQNPRPGAFDISPNICYPESAGIFIKGIPKSKPLGGNSPGTDAHQLALLNLCLLAEKILWPKLFDAAIEGYIRGELASHRPIPVEHVDLIYARASSDSSLRTYTLESMCSNAQQHNSMYMPLAKKYDDFMEDVLNRLCNWQYQKDLVWDDETIQSFCMHPLEHGSTVNKEIEMDRVL